MEKLEPGISSLASCVFPNIYVLAVRRLFEWGSHDCWQDCTKFLWEDQMNLWLLFLEICRLYLFESVDCIHLNLILCESACC